MGWEQEGGACRCSALSAPTPETGLASDHQLLVARSQAGLVGRALAMREGEFVVMTDVHTLACVLTARAWAAYGGLLGAR